MIAGPEGLDRVSSTSPVLSLVLCSRNDSYMGNSRWRLETALNFAADRVFEVCREADVELVVADWGSEVPLATVVALTDRAAALTSFVTIPPAVAKPAQRDSPFAEVIALNAAARRSRGIYIGRIDQDTLTGGRFLRTFFDMVEGRRSLASPMDRALLYSNRREVPYRFARQGPALWQVTRFVETFGRDLPVLRIPGWPFWTYYVGIWLAHRGLWQECGGYDERLIYYNWMETDMIRRLSARYPIVDLGEVIDQDFYHLDHVPIRVRGERHARKNGDIDWTAPPPEMHPNGPGWGLRDVPLQCEHATPRLVPDSGRGVVRQATFFGRVLRARVHDRWDIASFRAGHAVRRWRSRARKAWLGVRAQPVHQWPRRLAALWSGRATAGGHRPHRASHDGR